MLVVDKTFVFRIYNNKSISDRQQSTLESLFAIEMITCSRPCQKSALKQDYRWPGGRSYYQRCGFRLSCLLSFGRNVTLSSSIQRMSSCQRSYCIMPASTDILASR